MRRQAAPSQETHSCLINSILIYKNIFQFFFLAFVLSGEVEPSEGILGHQLSNFIFFYLFVEL
jgi:hypothetical protein